MYKILALAQNVGGLPKYRRQMYAANKGGKCRRQMLAANLCGIVKLLRLFLISLFCCYSLFRYKKVPQERYMFKKAMNRYNQRTYILKTNETAAFLRKIMALKQFHYFNAHHCSKVQLIRGMRKSKLKHKLQYERTSDNNLKNGLKPNT